MNIIYSFEEGTNAEKSIFLAGPTPRDEKTKTWRCDALKLLSDMNFDGDVFVPEYRDGVRDTVNVNEWETRSLWERKYLEGCSAILFWVPRNLENMPAFTTNVEFGKFVPSGKAIYGRPNEAPKNEYLDWFYKFETSRAPLETLEDTVRETLNFINAK